MSRMIRTFFLLNSKLGPPSTQIITIIHKKTRLGNNKKLHGAGRSFCELREPAPVFDIDGAA